MRYLTRYLTAETRPTLAWQIGIETDDLLTAGRDCAHRRAFNPNVWHTQVIDQEQGNKHVYFCDNLWAAHYHLAYWAGCSSDEATVIADRVTAHQTEIESR